MKNWNRWVRSDGVTVRSPKKRFYVHGPEGDRISHRPFTDPNDAKKHANKIWPLGHVCIRIAVDPATVKNFTTLGR